MSDCLKREGAKFVGDTAHVMPTSKCLNCGYEMDRASCVNNDCAPDPGDITICMSCGHLMAFADDLSLRALTDAEMVAVAGNKRIVDIQRARAGVMSKAKGPSS